MNVDFFEGQSMFVGEIKPKVIQVAHGDGSSVSITAATYLVYEFDGDALSETPANAIITNNHSSLVSISAPVTATEEGTYYVEITYTEGSYIGKARIKFKVKE